MRAGSPPSISLSTREEVVSTRDDAASCALAGAAEARDDIEGEGRNVVMATRGDSEGSTANDARHPRGDGVVSELLAVGVDGVVLGGHDTKLFTIPEGDESRDVCEVSRSACCMRGAICWGSSGMPLTPVCLPSTGVEDPEGMHTHPNGETPRAGGDDEGSEEPIDGGGEGTEVRETGGGNSAASLVTGTETARARGSVRSTRCA